MVWFSLTWFNARILDYRHLNTYMSSPLGLYLDLAEASNKALASVTEVITAQHQCPCKAIIMSNNYAVIPAISWSQSESNTYPYTFRH